MRKPDARLQAPAGRVTVTVDGWSCADGYNGDVDTTGNLWVLQNLEGWFGGVDVRSNPISRPLLDGDYDGPISMGARTVTLSGTLVAPNVEALFRGMDTIAGVLAGPRRRTGTLVVSEAVRGLVRQIPCRLGGPTMVSRTGRHTAEFSVALYSPSPARFGLPRTANLFDAPGVGRAYDLTFPRTYGALGGTGTEDLFNTGDGDSFPLIVFVGPVENPTLTRMDTGESFRLLTTLAVGESVQIDCAKRTVTFRGESYRMFLAAGSRWPVIHSGHNRFHFESDINDIRGGAVITWQESWS